MENNTKATLKIGNKELENLKNKSSHGGAREGAGRPKGSMNKNTIEEKEALAQFKGRVREMVDKIFNAQASLALGVQYVIRIEEEKDSKGRVKKKHIRVTDPDEMIMALDEGLGDIGGSYYYLTAKDPDNKALDSLMDRGFGNTVQSIQAEVSTVSLDEMKKAFSGESEEKE